jgi:hypothetical protein
MILRNALGAAVLAVGFSTAAANAAVVFDDNFDAYLNQDLFGQGGWLQTGTSTTTPVQVAGGADKYAAIGTSGQDLYKAFSTAVPKVDGDGLLTSIELNVTAAGTGDYFFHLSDPVGTTSNFYQRLHVRSSGAGYQVGMLAASGTGAIVTYGTTVLNFNQTYDVDIDWNFVAGTQNDTFDVTVDGAAYLTHTWNSTTVNEPNTISAANFRQGSTSAAPTVQADMIVIEHVVPEPTSLATIGLGGLALLRRRRGR